MVHIHAEGPAFFTWLPKMFGKRVVVTVHGIDWQREKWQSGLGSKFIHQGEKNAAKYADEVIVLSKGVQDYFKETYGRETHFIPNGVNRPQIREAKLITDNFGLEKDSYILFLGRLVPEKGIRYLVEAFKNVETDKKLVIAGGSSDTDSFMEELKELAKGDDRILFTGFVDNESNVRVNRKMELVTVPEASGGNAMIGICYLIKEDADVVEKRVAELCKNQRYDGSFWEEALYHKDRMMVAARVVHSTDVVEINTYEQLREIDSDSSQLKTDAIQVICKALNADANDVTDITVLKKGMTNRSFLFTCKGKKYIMRIPGEGTDQLINRRQEAEVYHTIDGKKICDDIAYINPENGYKITEFLEGARVCDPLNYEDVKKCMKRLRNFHEMKLKVNHEFDIFGQMEFYESLWDGMPSVYKDYAKTKANILSLKEYIDAYVSEKVLTHIDAVPDNFLFIEKDGQEEIRLIDWEYAGMQDPHVDVAMFCIYSLYNKRQVDRLIAAYFTEGCDDATRIKIYCYIAACGLLWSNWCEYKRNLGVEFGEYSLRQYRYAKEYYRIVQDELKKQKEREDN